MIAVFLHVVPRLMSAAAVWPPLSLNPMVGIVMVFCSAILGLDYDFPCLEISTATMLVSFLFGVYYSSTDRASLG
jgi:hypothetical protein